MASGAVLFPSGRDFVVLDVAPGAARCACADADGNGAVGLTRIEVLAHDPRSGELAPVTLTPLAGQDIDRFGRHSIEIRVGEERAALTALVLPPRPRRKRRRQRRGTRLPCHSPHCAVRASVGAARS